MPVRLPPSGPLKIQGIAQVGQLLIAARQLAQPTYRWQNGVDPNWSDIAGAAGLSYTVQSSDAAGYVRIVETSQTVDRAASPTGPFSGSRRALITAAWLKAPSSTARSAKITWARLAAP